MLKQLAVCGTFLTNDWKYSGYMGKLFANANINVINGACFDRLPNILQTVKNYDIIYWFPDIPNDKEKLLSTIKQLNPKCILVSSKNNTGEKYTHADLIARALHSKSNLLLELKKDSGIICATLHDPLGNVFVKDEGDIDKVRFTLLKRTHELANFTRAKSLKVGPALPPPAKSQFFNLVREYADKFHEIIHAANKERLLGNASFRCERGFPGFRGGDLLFVSRRNIDKRFIGSDGFVAVLANFNDNTVKYFGDIKPSVDTPIQIKLFNYYKNIKYILHSHTYIHDAPFTKEVIPCGALEEFDHIKEMFPNNEHKCMFINLKGHGSIALVNNSVSLLNIPYISRPAPETQC